ncbi:MAG: hypothetical protein M3464_04190 [Chloroflexota bacterium]|nr:hypothetical protein [Chloroflexota bacterium]
MSDRDAEPQVEVMLREVADEVARTEPADMALWVEARVINDQALRLVEDLLRKAITQAEFLARIAELQEHASPEAFLLASRLAQMNARLRMWTSP